MSTSHPPLFSRALYLSIQNRRLHLDPPRLDALQILMVDDEPDARTALAKLLRGVGAVVTTAGSAAEALQIIDTVQPQLLLSDIGMPLQDGYDLIRLVRKSGRTAHDLPAIAVTAYGQDDDVREAHRAGFQLLIAKPVDPYNLIVLIAGISGRISMPDHDRHLTADETLKSMLDCVLRLRQGLAEFAGEIKKTLSPHDK